MLLVRAFAVAASTLGLFDLAYAAPEFICTQYAQTAVAVQQQNLANACGLAGDRWSLNFGGHKSWCLSASQTSVDAETNVRSGEIAKCMSCVGYAQLAVMAQQQNLTNGCGRSGDRWSLDFNGHRSWCMGAPQSSIDAESAARLGELAKCTSCSSYAQEAFSAQQQNVANGCGLSGDRWSLNTAGHKSWCMGAAQASIDGETNVRRSELSKCTRCTVYAQEAVNAQNLNIAQCQFAGDRWSNNFAGHRAWCMGASEFAINGETAARQQALSRCVSRCRAYALSALDAQRQNLNNGCRYAGDRWSENVSGHITWCVGASDAQTANEENERKKMLAACLSPGKKAACEAYADTAVMQFSRISGTSAHCEYRDRRRWHGDWRNHFNWCMAVELGLPPQEVQAREQELIRCSMPTSPGSGPDATEQCSVSVRMKIKECLNLDGSKSSILTPGTLSTFACGGDDDAASKRAKASLQWLGMCVSDGDDPDPGCCTIEKEQVPGCLCR